MDNYAKFLECESMSNIPYIVKLASANKIDIVIIGPELPLREGLVNELNKINIKTVGPTMELAQIETSKTFARELMINIGLHDNIPQFLSFEPGDNSYIDLLEYSTNVVIKADGLHGGKGVKVFGDHLHSFDECVEYCKEIHNAGERFLIEEKLVGQEFSYISFCDGSSIQHTIPVKDFKRAYEGDNGPNTGSMGSITEYNNRLDFLTDDDILTCQLINDMVINCLQYKCSSLYKGIIYGGFMKTESGIKIIEYNARFGDPECINILELMETEFYKVIVAIVEEKLSNLELKFKPDASVFKYLVPLGYPDNPVKKELFTYNPEHNQQLIGASIGSAKDANNKLYELGSRAIGYIVTGVDLNDCAAECNRLSDSVKGPLFYRKDIGLNTSDNGKSLYEKSGVNIEEGNETVKKIQSYVESTFNDNVVSNFGDFSGMFKLSGYKNPVLVSTTDGVGTKSILVLKKYGPKVGYRMLGRDIVNHCVNDILVKGAKPLFFLDYFAANKINSEHVKYFVSGIAQACKDANCVLIGGETAEMPDVYNTGHSDIVGTMIGVVEQDKIVDGKRNIKQGDIVIGFQSSGPHTNGYSLIRKIVDDYENINGKMPSDIIMNLCATHKSYLPIYEYLTGNNVKIKGMVHITGGGFEDNVPRVLPEGMSIKYEKWDYSPIFQYIQKIGNVSDKEMNRVFNCGIGMVMIIDNDNYKVLKKLNKTMKFTIMGYVE
jgi:phosphoribosylaminoimidazole synthetase/phosphoribosylamine--glycine ligase